MWQLSRWWGYTNAPPHKTIYKGIKVRSKIFLKGSAFVHRILFVKFKMNDWLVWDGDIEVKAKSVIIFPLLISPVEVINQGHFLISLHTIIHLSATSGVTPYWTLVTVDIGFTLETWKHCNFYGQWLCCVPLQVFCFFHMNEKYLYGFTILWKISNLNECPWKLIGFFF